VRYALNIIISLVMLPFLVLAMLVYLFFNSGYMIDIVSRNIAEKYIASKERRGE
jgi:isoprenylcysteine carboxyl methyltransferase (ICMT) family protein YpbQ